MSEFIKVTKNGEAIEVHPDALEDHKRLGWVEVVDAESQPEAEKPAEEAPAPKAEKPKRGK